MICYNQNPDEYAIPIIIITNVKVMNKKLIMAAKVIVEPMTVTVIVTPTTWLAGTRWNQTSAWQSVTTCFSVYLSCCKSFPTFIVTSINVHINVLCLR